MTQGPHSTLSDLAGCLLWGTIAFCYIGGGWMLLAAGAFGVGMILGMFV